MFYKARQQFFRFFRIRSSLHTHAWKMTCATTDPRQNYYNIINGTQGNLCNKQTNKCKKSMQHYHMTERSHVPSRPCSHLHWTLNRESEANRLNWQWVDVYQYLIHHFPTHVSTHLHFLSIHMLPKIFSESISGQLSFIKLDLFWFLWKVNRVEWAGTVLGQRLLWKGITEESRHFRISLLRIWWPLASLAWLLGMANLVVNHTTRLLLQGHLTCPVGMLVKIGNWEPEPESKEPEPESKSQKFWEERQDV